MSTPPPEAPETAIPSLYSHSVPSDVSGASQAAYPCGRLILVGTMQVRGEELTGFFVEASPEHIRSLPSIPFYKTVSLVPVTFLP